MQHIIEWILISFGNLTKKNTPTHTPTHPRGVGAASGVFLFEKSKESTVFIDLFQINNQYKYITKVKFVFMMVILRAEKLKNKANKVHKVQKNKR